ncbi:MAG: hypothetical protein JO170_34685 [Verrucomicrobia bacterium]|nr:hypothetical protein [Verrucomicrobiota bacterium]
MKKQFFLQLTTFSFGVLAAFAGPTASPSPSASPTGSLPSGLDPSKVNLSVYQNLPGIQPPTLDLDGRDLSGEALSMINTVRSASLLPGMPTGSLTPQPFPTNPLSTLMPAASPSPSAIP